MTIDERLEAIAQSLELLTADVRSLERTVRSQDGRIDALTTACMSLLESTRDLRVIVESHERRLSRLEERS